MPDCPWCSVWKFSAPTRKTLAFKKALLGCSDLGGRRRHSRQRHARLSQGFDDLTTNMIDAGETGGILDTILQRLSQYVEKAVKMRAAVKSALDLPGLGHRDCSAHGRRTAEVRGADLRQTVRRLGVDLPLPPVRD